MYSIIEFLSHVIFALGEKKCECGRQACAFCTGGDFMKIRTNTQIEWILRTAFCLDGNSIKDVAERAGINLNTVKTVLHNCFFKLQTKTPFFSCFYMEKGDKQLSYQRGVNPKQPTGLVQHFSYLRGLWEEFWFTSLLLPHCRKLFKLHKKGTPLRVCLKQLI